MISASPEPSAQIEALKLLHLEDSQLDHELVCRAMAQQGLDCAVTRVETLEELKLTLLELPFDAVLADYRLSGFTALNAWEVVQTINPAPPIVLVSGAIGETAAVEAIQLGFSDYVLKHSLHKLAFVVTRAIEQNRSRLEQLRTQQQLAWSEKRLVELTEHLQLAIEEERASIAREIHDDIGGSLAAIKFELAWIQRHHSDPETRQHIATATVMLQQALEASQRIMHNLRPAILNQGLEAALSWLTREFEKRTHITVDARIMPMATSLSKSIELAAYRTAQEALTNISKHAACNSVRIELSDLGHNLLLEITDNGCGMKLDDQDKSRSFGLRGLHERARQVGGWLDISSTEGAGTSITLTIPLEAS
jgi:signal transduction histidine kinase